MTTATTGATTGSPTATNQKTAEHIRLDEAAAGKRWRRFGTYLSERQWGTVREDYSANGDAWGSFPHEHARSRAYRWGEDGLMGLCDNRGLFNVSVALWNGKDPYLKERLFGLSGPEGNHGEDVKEVFYYVDAVPTCAYARGLYVYPQAEFPYDALRKMSAERSREQPSPRLQETGVFADQRYFSLEVEYAKHDWDDIVCKWTVKNHGAEPATIDVLPTFVFRNTWAWSVPAKDQTAALIAQRPELRAVAPLPTAQVICAREAFLGTFYIYAEEDTELLFTENDTNQRKLYDVPNRSSFSKDAFHEYIVKNDRHAVNPARSGTKAAVHKRVTLAAGESRSFYARVTWKKETDPFAGVEELFTKRRGEADEFYASVAPVELDEPERRVMRESFAGLLWCKQYYNFDVERWLRGDEGQPPPPAERKAGRNREWRHLYNSEVLSMPDKWEYPWYAAWDLAFHAIPMALIDPDFAKNQLSLLLREWYMHPNGQLPAYEWSFSDVNPPVHAWAALRVYQIDRRITGKSDRQFLESVFHKLMLNFTWWVNRKDAAGNNVFQGGFLGLDNIGVFDRSNAKLPQGGELEQADATSWMGMYCLNLLAIALELAEENKSYQDVANKFFEHFLLISHAMNDTAAETKLWDEQDGFFYDVLHLPGGAAVPMKLRSMVGLIPLFAVESLEATDLDKFPEFVKRARWFISNRPELAGSAMWIDRDGTRGRRLLSILSRNRLARVLSRVLDETEFLSPYGVRALSRAHAAAPYEVELEGAKYRVEYEPGESRSGLFGGNSNWRGPVWFPVNFLIIESLQRYHHYYGDDFRVECPVGSGKYMNLWEVASELSRRLCSLFLPNAEGVRPADGKDRLADPFFYEHPLFYEFFHGDDGSGLGASHQTGWTALVAKLLQQKPLWGNAPPPGT